MLNVFNLRQAVNEAAMYGSFSATADVAAHPFTGLGLTESISEGISLVMDEAVCYSEYTLAAEEIMVEAAVSNPDRMDILSENIFDTIKVGAKKFFDKIVSIVKGIIEKLKAFFFKFTGKTSSWLKIMKPKIQAAQTKRAGNAELAAEMHEWNTDYVNSGMSSGIKSMMDEWKSEVDGKSYEKSVETVRSMAKKYVGMNPDSFEETTHTDMKNQIEKIKDATEETSDKIVKSLNTNLGINGTDVASCLSDVRKKGNGGEKTTVKYNSNVSSMLSAVESSAKTIKEMEKLYNEYLKELTKYRNSIDKSSDIKLENEDKMPNGAATVAREYLRVTLDSIIKITSGYHSAIDGVRQVNIGLINDMTREYMTVLTKFVGAKEPKKD